MPPRIALIVAVARNGVIGNKDGLPWHLPLDLARFRKLTVGHTIIMGRKTWESLPRKPLPNRRNIVVTRNTSFITEGAETVPSITSALERYPEEKFFLIGGRELFIQGIQYAETLLVTLVETDPEGDTSFPEILSLNPREWWLVSKSVDPRNSEDQPHSSFLWYERIKNPHAP